MQGKIYYIVDNINNITEGKEPNMSTEVERLNKYNSLVKELGLVDAQQTIHVQLDKPGFQRWLDAPKEVAFLRNYHRHLFNIKLAIVIDNDREVEYFIALHKLELFIQEYIEGQELFTPDFAGEEFYIETGQDPDVTLVIGSCEKFAYWLLKRAEEEWGSDASIAVEVYEDKENGSKVENYY